MDNLSKQRLEDIRKFGVSSMAYSALQGGIKEFRSREFEGFIAYQDFKNKTYVLSDPITDSGQYRTATALFLKEKPGSLFCQVNSDYAAVLRDLGLYLTGLGVENILDLKDFEVSWRVRRNLKRIFSHFSNMGFYIEEASKDKVILKEINDQWLKLKHNKKELSFLARPFIFSEEPDVRFFLLKREEEIFGFCSFDPVYSRSGNGMVDSYVIQHLRVKAMSEHGAADFILLSVLKLFKEQGCRYVSLGLSPLYQREQPAEGKDFIVEYLLDRFYNKGGLYSCKSIGEHKDRYHPIKQQTYLGLSRKRDVWGIYNFAKINHLM